MVSHDSARAWLNVSFTESRARACYVLVRILWYDSDSLSPGPGHVLVRIPLHGSPSPSYLQAGTRYLCMFMMVRGWRPGWHLILSTETRSRGPGHVIYIFGIGFWSAWFYITESLNKGPGHVICIYDIWFCYIWSYSPSPLSEGRDTFYAYVIYNIIWAFRAFCIMSDICQYLSIPYVL